MEEEKPRDSYKKSAHDLCLPQEPSDTTQNNKPEDRRRAGPAPSRPPQPRPRTGRNVIPFSSDDHEDEHAATDTTRGLSQDR